MKSIFSVSRILYVGIGMIMITGGCTSDRGKEGVQRITGDLSNVTDHEIKRENIVRLQTTDSSLIYDINIMEKIDGKLLVQSRSFVRLFDPVTGSYLGDFAHRGQGPGEYDDISHIWVQNDTVNILDFNKKTIHRYLPTGEYVGTDNRCYNITPADDREMGYSPMFLTESPDGDGYYIINCYTGGSTKSNPKFSFISANGSPTDIPGYERTDGMSTPDQMIADSTGHRVLAWEQLRDTLYQVTLQGVKAIYAFDFGANSFPSECQGIPDFYDRVQKFQAAQKDGKSYVSLLKYFQPVGDAIYFSAYNSADKEYLCKLDTRDNTLKILHLTMPGHPEVSQQPFFKIIGDTAYVALSDKESFEDNPMLYLMPLAEF